MRIETAFDRMWVTLEVLDPTLVEQAAHLETLLFGAGVSAILTGTISALFVPALLAIVAVGASALLLATTMDRPRPVSLRFRIDRGGVWLDDERCHLLPTEKGLLVDGVLHPWAGEIALGHLQSLLPSTQQGEVPAALAALQAQRDH